MPRINDYSEQQVGGQGPSGAMSADIRGASVQGDILQKAGALLGEIGDGLHKREAQGEVTQVYADMAKARADWTNHINKGLKDGSLDVEAIKDQYDEYMAKTGENLGTAEGKDYFNRQSSRLGANLLVTAAKGQAVLAGKKATAAWRSGLDNNSSALMSNPADFQTVYEETIDAVDAQVATNGLPAEMAEKFKHESGVELAKSAVRGWAQMDPDLANHLLNKGAFDQYFNGDVKAQMQGYINQAGRAKEIEERRVEKATKDAEKLAGEKWENDVLPKLANGSLNTKTILDSPLTPEKKIQWMKLADQATKEKTQSDPRVKNDLTRRILLPDGDPNKISDIGELSKWAGRGIDVNDVQQLAGFMQKTPEGQALSNNRKALDDFATAKLIKKDPMNPFMTDADSEYNKAQFQVALQQKEAQFRQEGKPLNSLYDPNSPDYFGYEIDKYKLSPQQVLEKKAGILKKVPITSQGQTTDAAGGAGTTPAAKTRQPKETPEAYLKRMGIK